MVTIIGYSVRENKAGKLFVSLQLQGELEMVQSIKTGRFYATCRRSSISSTFDEEMAKSLIGSKYPGSIKRVQCEAYEFAIPETGEVINLAHSYQYVPEEAPVLQTSHQPVVRVVTPA